jgi:hypothetical protein
MHGQRPSCSAAKNLPPGSICHNRFRDRDCQLASRPFILAVERIVCVSPATSFVSLVSWGGARPHMPLRRAWGRASPQHAATQSLGLGSRVRVTGNHLADKLHRAC